MTSKTVANMNDLWAAIKAASPGDQILVSEGNYSILSLRMMNIPSPGVTIQPVTGARVVINNAEHDTCSGIHYKGIEFYTKDNTQHNGAYSVYFVNSHDCSVDGSKIHGPVVASKAPASGVGVFIRLSTNISITNNELFDLGAAGGQMDSVGTVIDGNNVHDVRSDGFDNSGAINPVVTNNTFTDFYPVVDATGTDHPDGIQFWGTTANPVGKGAIVRGNVIKRGKGHAINPDGSASTLALWPQGIFAENQADMTIEDNAMVGTLFNGISVSGTSGALIKDNFVQGGVDMGSRIIARGQSSNITITGNEVSDALVNYVDNGKPNVNFVDTGDNVKISAAVVTNGVVDTSQLDKWLASKNPTPVQPPPAVTPPAPTPIPDPANLLIIADLKTQVASLKGVNQALTDKITNAQAALA